jgi:hypothetical protein
MGDKGGYASSIMHHVLLSLHCFIYNFDTGDMVYVSVMGQLMLIPNSEKAAVDILHKKGNSRSDRPHLEMCHLIGQQNTLVLPDYRERYRNFRNQIYASINLSDLSNIKIFLLP